MDLTGGIRKIASKLVEATESPGNAPVFKQGVVTAVTYASRICNVTIDSGVLTGVVFVGFVPQVGQTIWLAYLGAGRWVTLGAQSPFPAPGTRVFVGEQIAAGGESSLPAITVPTDGVSLICEFMGGLSGATAIASGIRVNGDTGANYTLSQMYVKYGSGVGTSATGITGGMYLGDLVYDSDRPFLQTGCIPLFRATNLRKTARFHSGMLTGAASANAPVAVGASTWESGAAITSVQIVTLFGASMSMVAGTRFRVWVEY